ncbi:hypothetical protein [Bradyrhizobium ivorense]|uniref:hypothetical protein n=1 Tax=Bradyrhizobium ivorense TaxID=2511166 RepID=UPI0011247D09|nr:hypothetical protein [Bradyrhizobium ivorense]
MLEELVAAEDLAMDSPPAFEELGREVIGVLEDRNLAISASGPVWFVLVDRAKRCSTNEQSIVCGGFTSGARDDRVQP